MGRRRPAAHLDPDLDRLQYLAFGCARRLAVAASSSVIDVP